MTTRFTRACALVAAVAVLAGAATTFAQRGFRSPYQREPSASNPKYDGRFMFARLKYTSGPGGYYYCGLPAWAHGYVSCRGGSRAESNLMKIMNELSYLNAHVEESAVFALDDPELSKYPLAYMTEAGYWTATDKEAAAFRAYLLKGAFVIFDDFRDPPRGGGGWENFEANMRRVLPEGRFVDLNPSYPIFDSFFKIESFEIIPQFYDVMVRPTIRGLFEDNDPKKRLMAIVNHSTDIAQYWEFSSTGFRPISEANEAYKLGVNYIMYGMTH